MKLKMIALAVITTANMFFGVVQARTPISGLDLSGYCASIGFSQIVLLKGTQVSYKAAFENWACSNGTAKREVNMDKACRWQNSTRPYVIAWPLDPHDAYSWKCYIDL